MAMVINNVQSLADVRKASAKVGSFFIARKIQLYIRIILWSSKT